MKKCLFAYCWMFFMATSTEAQSYVVSDQLGSLSREDMFEQPEEVFRLLSRHFRSDKFTIHSCVADLGKANFLLREFSPAKLNPDFLQSDHRSLWTSQLIGLIRNMRSAVADRYREFYWNNYWNEECFSRVRKFERLARYVDNLLDHTAHYPLLRHSSVKYDTFDGVVASIHLRHYDFKSSEDLKSGDVLLTRGFEMTSAGIAYIGTADSDFSHLAVVYKDPETGQSYVVDAKPSYNLGVHSIEEYFKKKRTRLAVYRHRDPEIAHHSAQYIYDLVSEAVLNEREILFDLLADDFQEGSTSCSVLVNESYRNIAEGEGIIEELFSRIDLQNEEVAARLGENNVQFFFPGDMEVQPNFELVAEWFDPNELWETQLYDVIAYAIFDWLGRFSYELKQTSKSKFAQDVVRKSQSGGKGAIDLAEKHDVPETMSPELASLIVDLSVVGECLFKKLRKYERRWRRKNDAYPMGWQDRLDHLNYIRRVYEERGSRLCDALHINTR